MARERDAAAGVQHGEQHGKAVAVPADDGAARRAEPGRRDQRLDFDEERPRPFDAGKHGGARAEAVAVAEKQLGRVGNLLQPARHHLEHADLVGRPEAVLDGAQDADRDGRGRLRNRARYRPCAR